MFSFCTLKATASLTAIAMSSALIGTTVDMVNETTPISLGAAIGVGAAIVGGAWFLSSRLTKIDERLKGIERKIGINGHYRKEDEH